MEQRKKAMLYGTGMITAGITALGTASHMVTKMLVSCAMDRRQPRGFAMAAKYQIRRMPSYQNLQNAIEQASKRLKKMKCEKVEIKSHDGMTLVGHWMPVDNSKRILIAMHGWRSSWINDFSLGVDFFLKSGCSVLFPEQRAQGGSGGAYMGFGMLERYDCEKWIQWVNKKVGSKFPLYLCGISMGASTVLMTAGFSLPANVRGIIADCGFTSARAIWKHVLNHGLHLSYGIHGLGANVLCRKRIQMGNADYTTLDAMRNCSVPVLFIHGTEDDFVPVEMTYENYKACSGEKYLFVVPGAAHGMSYFVDQAGYEKACLDFWEKYDVF